MILVKLVNYFTYLFICKREMVNFNFLELGLCL